MLEAYALLFLCSLSHRRIYRYYRREYRGIAELVEFERESSVRWERCNAWAEDMQRLGGRDATLLGKSCDKDVYQVLKNDIQNQSHERQTEEM